MERLQPIVLICVNLSMNGLLFMDIPLQIILNLFFSFKQTGEGDLDVYVSSERERESHI